MNDSEGHDKGDEALIQIAKNLLAIFKPENVYRVGYDFFEQVTNFTPALKRVDTLMYADKDNFYKDMRKTHSLGDR